MNSYGKQINRSSGRYEFSIVWTPIPFLTWLMPMIGHSGICTSEGIIRDFAGPYYVSEDDMAFGSPTKYWRLDVNRAKNGIQGWDHAVQEASEIYGAKMHTLCWDNCHSHVALALNLMEYNESKRWNAFKIGYNLFLNGTYVSKRAWLITWIPFLTITTFTFSLIFYNSYF